MQLSKPVQAQLTMTAGAGSVVAGTYGLLGWPWAAVVAGGYAVGFGMLFVDVEEPPGPPGDAPPRRRRVIERGGRR